MRALLLLMTVAAAGDSLADQKVVHFKKLEAFLPTKDVGGFSRGKPTGSTTNAMNMTMSEASVRYTRPGTDGRSDSIDVKIADLSSIPFGAMAMGAPGLVTGDFENETENGYEKSVTVKNHKATEQVTKGGSKSAHLSVPIGNRFIVTLDGSGFDDPSLLHGLAESMDLDKLEKVAP